MEQEDTSVVPEQVNEAEVPTQPEQTTVVPEQIVLPDQSVDPGFQRAPADAPTVDVETPLGTLRGSIEGELQRFRGIRYATAARFEAPTPVEAWSGVHEALGDGPMCPQPKFGLSLLALPKRIPPMNEDCFFLNITKPAAASETPRPVMVWIHGGAYVNGAGGGQIYDPSRIAADGDVIVVGINYRLGVFGFLPIEGVAPANLGMHDQLTALEWVKNNIASFGGDPENITLFGQSAGADAIAHLLAVPEADDLYHRVILQSPPLGLNVGREKLAPQLSANFVAALGRNDRAADPRIAPVLDMLHAQVAAMKGLDGDRLTSGMPYAPTPGVWPIAPASERAERLARRAPQIEAIIGYNRDDFSPFIDAVKALRVAQASRALRPLTEPVTYALTMRGFGTPSLRLAAELDAAGAEVYTYRFDWRPAGTQWGACHCIELPFFWADEEYWRGSPMLGGVKWADLDRFGRVLRRTWAGFARTGRVSEISNPNFSLKRRRNRRTTA
ncbi:carboxylesterase/lipase family protein [Subtercola lobariae]|uniref:Carboxylic ester hydrolase n=1 Tax=Subtercola lobariae TaxID=1588641 RepID=A0A917B5D7_9MICO|nr:carboxylesterase family protein [Subtercola lobariae]GGF24959.1 carboxylic ester hydrolase [Subtercola lobariae]